MRSTTSRAAVALLTALALTLAGCSGPTSGVVHDKSYSAGYSSLLPVCTGKTCVTVPQYHPPRWSLDIYASTDDHGWIEVDETTYHQYEIGDRYPEGGAR